MAKQPSRGTRWASACAEAREALEAMQSLKEDLDQEIADLVQECLDKIQEKLDTAENKLQDDCQKATEAMQDLRDVQEEYQEWYDGLPENLAGSAVGEKLEAVTSLELEWEAELEMELPEIEVPAIELDLDELESMLDEAEGADLPLGFGRD